MEFRMMIARTYMLFLGLLMLILYFTSTLPDPTLTIRFKIIWGVITSIGTSFCWSTAIT